MSLTTFTMSCECVMAGCAGPLPIAASCLVRNTGAIAGDEVVMVYHAAGSAIRTEAGHAVPIKALVAFERVTLAAGETTKVLFELGQEAFALTNTRGDKVVYSGKRTLIFSRGTGKDVRLAATR